MSTEILENSRSAMKAAPAITAAPPAAPAKRPASVRRPVEDDDDDEAGFLRRNAVLLVIGVLAASGIGYIVAQPKSTAPPIVKKAAVPINIELPPPPPPATPPPPPPPKVEQPREEEMEAQAPVEEDTPPEPVADESPPLVGSNIPSDGKGDAYGLGKAGRGGTGTGRRLGGGGGSKFGYYAVQVQNSISGAMRRNRKTKSADMSVVARIWADQTGRITRASISGSSGDPAVDAALRDEVLTGLQLPSPPPADMKMPINLRLTARPGR